MAEPDWLSKAERWTVGALSAVHGALFLWAAANLPWTTWTTFSVASGLCGLCHGTTAVACAIAAKPRWVVGCWKLSSAVGLCLLLLVSWQVFTGGSYIASLYGQLGQGLFAALVAIWGLFVLMTLPLGAWGLVRTRQLPPHWPSWARSRHATRGAAVMLVAGFGIAGGFSRASAHPTPLASVSSETFQPLVEVLRPRAGEAIPWSDKSRRRAKRRVSCKQLPTETPTLIATYLHKDKAKSRCFHGETPADAASAAAAFMDRNQIRPPVKLDLLTAEARFKAGPDLVETFKLRPGLDGVCAGKRCLMPWQLVARGAFLENRPLEFVRDLRFGVSSDGLRRRLGNHTDTLLRVETQSALINVDGELVPLKRLRPEQLQVDQDTIAKAMQAAEQHVLDAQLDDGKFRYTLHPFSGKATTTNFNLARQAGTAFAMCEHASDSPNVKQAIVRALRLLLKHEKSSVGGELAGLVMKSSQTEARLASSALPLVAYLACRSRVGPSFDGSIARLARLVLALQRPDGGFHPRYDLNAERAIAGKEPLFAPGQSILALVLLQKLLAEDSLPPSLTSLDLSAIRSATARAMDYIAHEHWAHSMYPFFFIEENWHCLAAAEALEVHRDTAYEDFCLDYMSFKHRVILEQGSVAPEFVGGYGFGNVIPPHNTATAGYTESLTGAIEVMKARGLDSDKEQRLLLSSFGFLLRQQWTENNCFACVPQAIGAVSEHTHSPITRIDFVQHAWAGLAGVRVLDDHILNDTSRAKAEAMR